MTICFFLSSLRLSFWFFSPRSWTIPISYILGFPGGASGKESTCQRRRCKRCGFDPWVGKIPWSRKWQLTAVFLPGKFHGQRSLAGYSPWGRKSQTRLSARKYARTCTHTHTHTHTHTPQDEQNSPDILGKGASMCQITEA